MAAWEDYDFWVSLIDLGRTVYRIEDALFYYRQLHGSRDIPSSAETAPRRLNQRH
jgi:hypothetical protein